MISWTRGSLSTNGLPHVTMTVVHYGRDGICPTCLQLAGETAGAVEQSTPPKSTWNPRIGSLYTCFTYCTEPFSGSTLVFFGCACFRNHLICPGVGRYTVHM